MRHITEWFRESAGLFITLALISIVITGFTAVRRFGFLSFQQMTKEKEELADAAMEGYEGKFLNGSEVINAIKRYQNQIPVLVDNGQTQICYQGNFSPKTNLRENKNYIDPAKRFGGYVWKMDNGDYEKLQFIEESRMETGESNKEILSGILGENPETSSLDSLCTKAEQEAGKMKQENEELIRKIKEEEEAGKLRKEEILALSSENKTLKQVTDSLSSDAKKSGEKRLNREKDYHSILEALSQKGFDTGKDAEQIAASITNQGFGAELTSGRLTQMSPRKWHEVELGFRPQVVILTSYAQYKDYSKDILRQFNKYGFFTSREKGNLSYGELVVSVLGKENIRNYSMNNSSSFEYEIYDTGFRYFLHYQPDNYEAVKEFDATYLAF